MVPSCAPHFGGQTKGVVWGSEISPVEFELAKAYDTGVGVLQEQEGGIRLVSEGSQPSAQARAGESGGTTCSTGNGRNQRAGLKPTSGFNLAAAQGVAEAAKTRDALARKMSAQELAEASRRAKAFTSGEPPRTNNLPEMGAGRPAFADHFRWARSACLGDSRLTTKVTESNDTWWRWSYQLKVKNNTTGQSTTGDAFCSSTRKDSLLMTNFVRCSCRR